MNKDILRSTDNHLWVRHERSHLVWLIQHLDRVMRGASDPLDFRHARQVRGLVEARLYHPTQKQLSHPHRAPQVRLWLALPPELGKWLVRDLQGYLEGELEKKDSWQGSAIKELWKKKLQKEKV